ncbi:MAG: universal stress protein [Pseudomonadota bacterium]
MFKHILVPVDGSELSRAAAMQACGFARETGARLTFYHALPEYFPSALTGDALFDDATTYQAFHAAMARQSARILDEMAGIAREAGVDFAVVSGESDTPYRGIVETAEQRHCDLIFMASHGRRGASALLLGSETQKVLTHCRIPVMVYR